MAEPSRGPAARRRRPDPVELPRTARLTVPRLSDDLAERIRRLIISEDIAEGARLPPERDLAERFSDGRLDPAALSKLPDDEVVAALTAVPGIGPWTAQGALVLALRRQDVVLPGDLALRTAVRRAYELDHLPSQAEMLDIAEKWRPYRSVATSYLFSAAFDGPNG